jgi:hypothetical protein
MLCRGAWGLVRIDADEQRPLRLRRRERPREHSRQGSKQRRKQGTVRLHRHSRHCKKVSRFSDCRVCLRDLDSAARLFSKIHMVGGSCLARSGEDLQF